jgi:hypothetical protein
MNETHNAGVEGSSPSLSTEKSTTSASPAKPAPVKKARPSATKPDQAVTKSVTAGKGLAGIWDEATARDFARVMAEKQKWMEEFAAEQARLAMAKSAKVPAPPPGIGMPLPPPTLRPLGKAIPMPRPTFMAFDDGVPRFDVRVSKQPIRPIDGAHVSISDGTAAIGINTRDIPAMLRQLVQRLKAEGWSDSQVRMAMKPRTEAL